jgi:predicted O-methyltransferase YrrM
MNKEIVSVLQKLDKISQHEKLEDYEINRDEKMFAITKETGEFFNILLRGMKAKRILEVGTSVGFSTLWFADAILENQGKIVTIEKEPSKITRARANFEEAGVSSQIQILQGEALQILKNISGSNKSEQLELFDFAFLDADKELNIEYFDLILPMIKVGGILAVDNILYPEKFRPLMKKFIEHIKTKPNVQTVTLDLGNGEQITIKTS